MTTEEALHIVMNMFTLEDSHEAPETFVEDEECYKVNPDFYMYCIDKGYVTE